MTVNQFAVALLACVSLCQAGQTRTWVQTDYSDFEKGNLKRLSLRSNGRLTLAPKFQELFDSSSAYLWALSQDSKGNLYTGGGPGAKLYRITPKGEKKMLVELDALEVHAIAVDKKDQVFAATSPDGKVYKVSADGKSQVFYDPKTKYIWALAFNSKGELFVGTGDQGEIHAVPPDGKGRVFFKSDETHARSMTVDANDNIIVGTEPGGLILRISPAGQGFVLYQASKKEITAVAVAPDGSIVTAAVGNKQPSAGSFTPPPVPATPTPGPTGAAGPQRAPAPPPATLAPPTAVTVSGGTDVYRIDANGNPRKIWSRAQDIVYTIAFDAGGRPLLGTGNKGAIYRIDSDIIYTALLNAPPTQITALHSGRDGKIYAVTGNVGKVYEIGPGLEREGSIESDVFDSGNFTQWGRLSFQENGGSLSVVTRSGNLDQPQKNWSPWSAPITSAKGARITSPPARFLQWKAILTADSGGRSPELEAVEVAYLPRNIEPRVEQIEITPPNYRFPASLASAASPQSLSLPPIGRHPQRPAVPLGETSTPSMQYAKGFTGARWAASDENGDTLIYKVEIRGVNESEWKLLKDKVSEKYLSWDSTAFPDGEYRLRVTASDLPGNPKENALSTSLESDQFLIDNTPPRITGLTAARDKGKLRIRWKAVDALSNIAKAEYSLDGGDWMAVTPVTQLSDAPELDYDLTIDPASPGEHTVAVRVHDDYDNQGTDKVVIR